MKKPQIILGLFHVIIIKLGFMKKIYSHLILLLLASGTIDLRASYFELVAPEIAPAKDDLKLHGILKQSQKIDQNIPKKTLTFNDQVKVYSFEKYVNAKNVDEYFISNLNKNEAMKEYFCELGMSQQKFIDYKNGRDAGHHLRVKGIKYDQLQLDYKSLMKRFVTFSENVEICVELNKNYKEKKSEVELYQSIGIALGLGLVVTTSYIVYEWMKHTSENQCQ